MEQRIEVDAECFTDSVRWVEAFVKEKGKKVVLYDFQRKILKAEGDVVVVKARQLGISWITAIKALFKAIHEDNSLIVLVSLTKEQAQEYLRHAVIAYNSLPERAYIKGTDIWLKVRRALVTRGGEPSKTLLEFDNGSRVVALPNNPEAVRGYAATDVMWDEAAKFPHEEDMIAALEPTTSRGGHVHYISTHRGTQSRFYDLTQKVKMKHNDYQDYSYFDIPWSVMENPNPVDWPNRAKEDPEVIAYIKKIGKFRREFGDKSFFFLEEYCCIASDESIAMFTHETLRAAIKLWIDNGCKFRDPMRRYPVYVGLDIGRVKDSTIMVAFEDMPEYVQVLGIWEWIGMPFDAQRTLIREVLKNLKPTFIRIDHKGIGADIAETFQSELGSQTQLMDFTPKEKEMMVLNTYAKMMDNRIAIPPDSDEKGIKLYTQLHNVRREITPKVGTIRYVQSDENMHDDYMWAFCMGASLLITPIPSIVMGAIGDTERSIMRKDSGSSETQVTYEKKEQPLQLGITAGLIQEEEKRKRKSFNDFMLRSSGNPEHYDCPVCLGNHTTDSCSPGQCKYSGQTPQMERVNKLAMADEYVCHTCWANVVKVKK
jgi:phage FluMu gp28-like protein